MDAFDRITIDPKRMNGQPCIRDLRLTVRRALEIVALYPEREELKLEYPELEDEDIRQALAFAAANMGPHLERFDKLAGSIRGVFLPETAYDRDDA